ncbi:MAG: 50S ribosomal protein L22 [Clostridiales Family XIII bacterium]|jgi:large subunit ribosomal protein L22|nr:50S ribosomal protein L22 [Clostridiales Family XIII bacterium]
MDIKSELKYLRISDVKVIPVAKLIQGQVLAKAEEILKFKTGKAAEYLEKTLASAAANAENNNNLKRDNLYVREVTVLQGPILKRWRAGARGSAARIFKRTVHIKLFLSELKATDQKLIDKAREDKKNKDIRIASKKKSLEQEEEGSKVDKKEVEEKTKKSLKVEKTKGRDQDKNADKQAKLKKQAAFQPVKRVNKKDERNKG